MSGGKSSSRTLEAEPRNEISVGSNGTVRQESDAIPRRRPLCRKCRRWKSDVVRPQEKESSFNTFVGIGRCQDGMAQPSAKQPIAQGVCNCLRSPGTADHHPPESPKNQPQRLSHPRSVVWSTHTASRLEAVNSSD